MDVLVVSLAATSACAVGGDNHDLTTGIGPSSASATTSADDSGTDSSATTGVDTTPEESGADESSSVGDPGPTFIVDAVVVDFGTVNMLPVEEATVSVSGMPAVTTPTDENGAFQLQVPAGEISFIQVVKPGYWGALVRVDATAGNVSLGTINVANEAFIAAKVAAFDNFDLTKAALIGRSTATDTTLTLTKDGAPATAADEYFSIDAQINFTLGDNVTRSAGFPAIVFFDLDDQPPGTLAMGATHPTLACTVAEPTPPVHAQTITWVEVECS